MTSLYFDRGTAIIVKCHGEIMVEQKTNVVVVDWRLSSIQLDYLLNLSKLL